MTPTTLPVFALRSARDSSASGVPMMRSAEPVDVAWSRGEGWQAVRLPYAGGTTAMTVVLPDAGRLAAVRRLGLLDGPADPALDRLTRLAARLLRAPVALVSLVDADRQFFASSVGLPEPWATARQTPLTHSFCQHVVATGDVLAVDDATLLVTTNNTDGRSEPGRGDDRVLRVAVT